MRESLIRVSLALVSQENKGDKMTMLYDFLTSSEFRMRIEAIVEGFTQMKAVVLCGGLGTRLGLLTKDMPKPLLNVAGRPFIAHVLDRIVHPEITGLVLAAGFQWTKLRWR